LKQPIGGDKIPHQFTPPQFTKFLSCLHNDFESLIFTNYPLDIKLVKLAEFHLSGSGSAIYHFPKNTRKELIPSEFNNRNILFYQTGTV
jgi:hypothetical protein